LLVFKSAKIWCFSFVIGALLEARPEGGRGKGRPRVEWEEYVEGLAKKRGRRLP
jgi:hypothetical protein